MFFNPKPKERLHQKDVKLRELDINMEKLTREYQQLLEELDLSSEQIQEYVDNPDNFPHPRWENLQNEKKKLDEKLDLALNHIPDPRKAQKTFAERGTIQQNWIFVR